MKQQHLLFFFIASVLVSTGVSNPDQETKIQDIKTTFTVLSLDKRIDNLCVSKGDELITFNVYTRTRSQQIEYTGPRSIAFFHKSDQLDTSPTLSEPVCTVTVSGNDKRYLIFLGHSKNPQKYNAFAIPDCTDNFPVGSCRFINLAPYKIAVQISDQRFVIDERNYTNFTANISHKLQHNTVMISLPNDREPLPCFNGVLQFNPKMRTLYIVSPKARGRMGRIEIIPILEAFP